MAKKTRKKKQHSPKLKRSETSGQSAAEVSKKTAGQNLSKARSASFPKVPDPGPYDLWSEFSEEVNEGLDPAATVRSDFVLTLRITKKMRFELELAARITNTANAQLVKEYVDEGLKRRITWFDKEYASPLVEYWKGPEKIEREDGDMVYEAHKMDTGELLWHPLKFVRFLKVALLKPDLLDRSQRKILLAIMTDEKFWHAPIKRQAYQHEHKAEDTIERITLLENRPNICMVGYNWVGLEAVGDGETSEFDLEMPKLDSLSWELENIESILQAELNKVKEYIRIRKEAARVRWEEGDVNDPTY